MVETGYVLGMIRSLRLALPVALILAGGGLGAPPAIAHASAAIQMAAATDSTAASSDDKSAKKDDKSAKKTVKDKSAKTKTTEAKTKATEAKKSTAKKAGSKKSEAAAADEGKGAGKPVQIASFGDWGAFLAQGGKEKTCYALAQPKDRLPEKLKRDPAYVFISSRPGENIHNEVSIIMGFPMKDGGDAQADVAGTSFDLVAKGTNAWVKNPAQEAEFINAMKKSAKLVVKATSIKGNMTTDSYSLAGLTQALERVQKECP